MSKHRPELPCLVGAWRRPPNDLQVLFVFPCCSRRFWRKNSWDWNLAKGVVLWHSFSHIKWSQPPKKQYITLFHFIPWDPEIRDFLWLQSDPFWKKRMVGQGSNLKYFATATGGHKPILETVTVGVQSLGLGVVRRWNCQAPEPWNLLLGCKAGSIFVNQGFWKWKKNSFNINHLELMLLVCSRSPRFLPNSSCLQEQEVGGGHKAIHDDATAAKVLPRKRPAFHGMFADS